jgi:hypothetical protein
MKQFTVYYKKQPLVVSIDDEDFDRVMKYKWYGWKHRHTYYVVSHRSKRKETNGGRLHRFILNVSDPKLIDHIDGNGLNNQKSNLRITNDSINHLNSNRIYKRKKPENEIYHRCVGPHNGYFRFVVKSRTHTNKIYKTFPTLEEANLYSDSFFRKMNSRIKFNKSGVHPLR